MKKINLVDDGKTISSDEELCETFNQFFSNVVPSLNISKPKPFLMANENLDPIMSVSKSFDKYPRVKTRLTQPIISEKLAVMKLKRLSVT